MSSTIKIHEMVTVDDGDRVKTFGLSSEPIGEATITGDYTVMSKFSAAASDGEVTLWSRGNASDFEFLSFYIEGTTGFLNVAIQIGEPDAADDNNAKAGTLRWMHVDLPCKMGAFHLNTDSVRTHATVLTWYDDDAGRPTLWDNTPIEGKIYKVMVRNPGTAAVPIWRLIAN